MLQCYMLHYLFAIWVFKCLVAAAGAFDSRCWGLFNEGLTAAGLALVHVTHIGRLLVTSGQAAWGFWQI